MAKAAVLHAEDRRFESCRAYLWDGSSMEEHCADNAEVEGSTPSHPIAKAGVVELADTLDLKSSEL